MVMFNESQTLPEDPAELRTAAEGLVSLVKFQARSGESRHRAKRFYLLE